MPRASLANYARNKLRQVGRDYVDSLAVKAGEGDTTAIAELKEMSRNAGRVKTERKVVAEPETVVEIKSLDQINAEAPIQITKAGRRKSQKAA